METDSCNKRAIEQNRNYQATSLLQLPFFNKMIFDFAFLQQSKYSLRLVIIARELRRKCLGFFFQFRATNLNLASKEIWFFPALIKKAFLSPDQTGSRT